MSSDEQMPVWPPAWSRAFLAASVLAVIERRQPVHGYAIMSELKDTLGTDVRGGVVYPLLRSMEDDNLLDAHWEPGEGGPGRKTYSLTSEGSSELHEHRSGWSLFRQRFDTVIGGRTAKEDEHDE